MSSKLYTTIPAPRVPRNTFDRTRPNSLTMPFQYTLPTMVEEILPGDIYRVGLETFARLQPMIAPVMNNMKISSHAFFVPTRTINKHFSEFMWNNKNGDYTDVLPYMTLATCRELVIACEGESELKLAADLIRMFDYIGLPFRYSSKTTVEQFVDSWLSDVWNQRVGDSSKRINLCPFFAYVKVWSEYFRDENLQDDPFETFESETGEDVFEWTGYVGSKILTHALDFCELIKLRRRAWAHDRFTSSLPFAQRGPDVLLPIAGTAPVNITGGVAGIASTPAWDGVGLTVSKGPGKVPLDQVSYDGHLTPFKVEDAAGTPVRLTGLADFDNSELSTTINDFRRAERLQRWYENSARGGVRPNEATLAHFGVRTPDATLDRAEFLGGTMQPIVVSEVPQTSETTDGSPQGTLAGKGTSYKGAALCRASFTEHGFLIVLTSALVRANYWQGIPKMFSRMQRDEYYWPEFANLGEEPVFTKELYADEIVSEGEVFGYVPRYSDYKSAVGEIHGDMRSSLDFWTQSREFSNKPVLNEEFIFGNPSLSPFAVQSYYSDPIIATLQFTVKASRLMPFYGVPTI